MDLDTLLSGLPGIGFFMAKRLEKLELFTLSDLIFHFPFRYDDFSNVSNALDAQIGETVTLKGEVWSIKNIYTRTGKVLTQAIFNDGKAPIVLTWFNSSWITKQIATGDSLQVSGKLSKYKGRVTIMAPQWERIGANLDHLEGGLASHLHTGRLVPIYPETYGISSKWLRAKIYNFLPLVLPGVKEYLPDEVIGGMETLPKALSQIHFPKTLQEAEKARERFSFDEVFLIQLATLRARNIWQKKQLIKPWSIDQSKLEGFTHNLPFKLTSAQEKVLSEIIQDLKGNTPMNRLLQGEVGSGKTVVASAAAYLSHLNGFQTLFMAPTEILAWQHFETVSRLLEPFGITVGIYTGSRKSAEADVIIGTHALLSEKLSIKNVGLIIIDEQHRFGVAQRTTLRQRSKTPHFLTMTATPIPRTVALTLYGDLDLSVIDELPKGRPKISTHLVPEKKRSDSYTWIEKKVAGGDQVFIITPLIEESETLQSVRAAKKEIESLKKIFPRFKLGLLHGRMKAKEKEEVVSNFRSGKIQILVSTSVVEVGMDIPNATIIVIEGAERFGLAQLHQLRGRVGRGKKESFCLFYTSNARDSNQRLKCLETTFDGLKLSELDLKIRGSGEVFGTAQHGKWNLKIADLSSLALIEKTREAAKRLLKKDCSLDKYPLLKAKLTSLAPNVMPD